jgi:hypothetical protein
MIQVTEALMRLHHLAALLVFLATPTTSLGAADPPNKQTNPIEALEKFISNYHEKPAPDAVPQQFKALLAEDTLTQLNPHVFEMLAHSFGHIGSSNVKLVRHYEASFPNASDRGKVMVIRILRVCGDKETLAEIKKWESTTETKELKKELASARQFLADPKRTLPRDRPAQDPDDLDFFWADFLATGEYAPVSRILDVFDGPDQFRTAIDGYLKQNPGEKERQAIFAQLDELKLLQPGSKDKLLPGNLDLQVDQKMLPQAIRFMHDVLGESIEKLKLGIILRVTASWSVQSNMQQHPRLVELLKANQEKRPAESQALIKKWLTKK